MDFVSRLHYTLKNKWKSFDRTPFVPPSPDLIMLPLDSSLPIFSQIVYSPPDGKFGFQITWNGESDEEKALFRAQVDAQLQMLLLNRVIIDTKFGEWHHNFMTNFCNGSLNHPFVHQLPQRKKDKALIVGNGPSADATSQLFRNHCNEYEIYTCWHAASRIPACPGPDYICHASTVKPNDVTMQPFPGAVFVGEPTANPAFYEVARLSNGASTDNLFIHCDPSNAYDTSFADWRNEPHATINPASVIALVINTAIQCGHDDLTLIGVDLTGPGNNDAQKMAIEQFPQVYANIKFKNLSTSNLKGFENLHT